MKFHSEAQIQFSTISVYLSGTVTYSIVSGNDDGKFEIDPTTGTVVLIDQIDFEATNIANPHILTIHGTDGGLPPLTGTTMLTVTVTDVNDNVPTCSPALMSLAVPESTAGSASIVILTCTDADATVNGELEYSVSIVNAGLIPKPFEIDANGEVTTAALTVLDYESTKSYNILIEVKDKGTPALSFTATVNVDITDFNEASPVFQSTPYTANVDENINIGSPVFIVTATDADTDDTITYSLTIANTYFEIDPITGEIKTIAVIDFDSLTSATIPLTVEASDGTNTVTETVTLTVINKNDGVPVFNPGVYAISIPEDTSEQTTVVTVTVSDIDDTTFTFSLPVGNNDSCFDVIANGTFGHLRLKDDANFDYDTKEKSYLLMVQAVDGAGTHTATASIAIQVTSVNEFPPTLNPMSIAVSIPENSNLGTSVDLVTATDADDGTDGDITFTMTTVTNNGAGKFTVNPTTGLVSLAGTLDMETETTYEIEILAADAGTVPGKNLKYFIVVEIMFPPTNCFSL